MAKGGIPVGRLSRRVLAAAFFLLLLTAGALVFLVALDRSISQGLLEAQLLAGAPDAPLARLSNTLLWVQAGIILTLSVATAALFALAWFLREQLLTPLEALRRSIAAASGGALGQPIAGLERKDEIGALARAAEKLRQTSFGSTDDSPDGFHRLLDRLSRDLVRLEADLAGVSSATVHAKTGIEEASVRAAKASHAALEAAGLVRESAQRITEESIAAATAAIARRSPAPPQAPQVRNAPDDDVDEHPGADALAGCFASDAEAASVLASLAGDLEALERFARDRRTIASESAAALTVALVEAIDRLNGVADRISATADLGVKDEAA